jgi:signal transduction histidine kinase
MRVVRRNRWFALAVAVTLMFAVLCRLTPRGYGRNAVSDIAYFLLILAVGLTLAWNAWSASAITRRFWVLMASGYLLWACNAGGWIYYEVAKHRPFPDPCFMDLFLFLHFIPMIAAVGLLAHRRPPEQKFRVGTLDFVLLLVWWIFLYAFAVFPSQYVDLNVPVYDRNFGVLYLVESSVLIVALGIVARGAGAGWRNIYFHLMLANGLYAVSSQAVNVAIARGTYYTGSLYDVPLMGSVAWMAAAGLSARDWRLEATTLLQDSDRWGAASVRLSMLAIVSLPELGLWTYLRDESPAPSKTFRLFTVLTAMLALGVFMFVRQYLQDQTLIRLLEDSRRSFENEQRLQSHLVQREKLASLGQLVAGAAHEIDQPLNAIMELSEKLWSNERLSGEQDTWLRKIVDHSQRTRDLIANLLSFAQQSSGEKKLLDLGMLVQRSVQIRELQRREQNVRIESHLDPELPQVWGDGHQLFQAFVQIAENGLEALEEAGGGLLRVSAHARGEEVVVQFSDSGPGIKEPHRVFDPFYTTKPVGRGTGLGLSAVYGVVQDHGGHITCQNEPQGGATFTIRLPRARADSEKLALAAAKS